MNNNKEIWKVINDSDGHYFISNLGNMKREEYYFVDKIGKRCYREEKYYKPTFNKQNGYYSYGYRINNFSHKNQYAHRLVALHFIQNPKPDIYTEVNHIDCNKLNNNCTNLEWCNKKLNMKHASKNNLINRDSEKRKEQTKINQVKSLQKLYKKVVEYDENGNFLKIYDCYSELKNKKGNKISMCAKRLSYYGKYYRDYNILIEKHGYIPTHINVSYIKQIQIKRRKCYKRFSEDGKITYYNKLSELPISREDLWFCFNHDIKDKENNIWDILNI